MHIVITKLESRLTFPRNPMNDALVASFLEYLVRMYESAEEESFAQGIETLNECILALRENRVRLQ